MFSYQYKHLAPLYKWGSPYICTHIHPNYFCRRNHHIGKLCAPYIHRYLVQSRSKMIIREQQGWQDETFPIATLIEDKHLRIDGRPPETLVDIGNRLSGTPAQYGKELCQDGTGKVLLDLAKISEAVGRRIGIIRRCKIISLNWASWETRSMFCFWPASSIVYCTPSRSSSCQRNKVSSL